MYNINIINNTINDITLLFIIILKWLFITIFKWTNPLYILLTPFVYIARLCHQVPILLNANSRKEQISSYNKYNIVALPSDSNFVQDKWQSFQYAEFNFPEGCDIDKYRENLDNWSMKNFKCKSNTINYEGNIKEYIETIIRKKPSQVIINATHLIVYFKNKLIIFMDHYFCDGLIIADFLKHLFYEDNISTIKFPKYICYPLISDYIAIEYFARTYIENIKYPPLINGIGDKTYLMSKIVQKNDELIWNRWTTYAHGIYNVYEALPQSVDYLRIGLTVGFDSDITFGNNRIGLIIVIIKRTPINLSHNEKILNYMEQFKNQTLARYTDALTCYDIIRSYNMTYIRTSKMKRVIDIYFTSIFFKEGTPQITRALGGFIGKININEYMYISAVSYGSSIYFTYVTNWKQLKLTDLTNNGLSIEYEFDNNDPNQF
uniref:Condensation domain-containing protein n=1 Tax=viral metagenome TaxID=1070528 RepID=A0A6C0H499_9ZZZZ